MKLFLFLLSVGFSLPLCGMGSNLRSQFAQAIKSNEYKKMEDILKIAPRGTVDVNVRIEEGDTLLHKVVRDNNYSLAQLLINNGAHVNARNTLDGNTPLMVAVLNDNVELASLLIAMGADVNIPDRHGMTPLHVAAGAGDIAMVRLLLSKGADATLQDVFNDTALDMARQEGYIAVAKLLEDYIKSQQTPQVELEDITVIPR
jgi:uncharacterized protein